METTTEADKNNRELTATEIKITLAQIEDRLIRFVEAAEETQKIWEGSLEEYPSEEDYEKHEAKRKKEIREKYQIPDGVHLMDECAINYEDIPVFMKFAKWWVKGEMNEESFDLFCYHFCEVVEVDFFWVLMDEPGNYYEIGMKKGSSRDDCGFVRLEPELKRIGTRSKKSQKINFKLTIGHGWG